MFEPIIYKILCVLRERLGSRRGMGYLETFFLATTTTPLVALPALLLTGPSRRIEWRRRS